MDELMHSLCCVLIMDCFVLAPKQGTTKKALRSLLAITHVYVVKFDILCFKI